MVALSEYSLNKFTKPKLITTFNNLQRKMTKVESMNNNVMDEVRKLNTNLEHLAGTLLKS